MAIIKTDGNALFVTLSRLEKLGALHGDVSVNLSCVKRAWVAEAPWRELRGYRAPGTGLPGVIMLGTTRGSFGKDFCAVYGRKPALIVELEGAEFSRLVVSVAEPHTLVERLARRSTLA